MDGLKQASQTSDAGRLRVLAASSYFAGSADCLGSQGPHCHTCSISPGESGPAVNPVPRTPAAFAAPSVLWRCPGTCKPPPTAISQVGKPLTLESFTTAAQKSRHISRFLMVARLAL